MRMNSASEMSSDGQLPLDRSWVSMKYFIAVSPFVRVVDRFRFRPAGGARAGRPASLRASTRCIYIFVATELVPSPDVAARPREQLQRSADAAYAFLAEHLARPLLGPAPHRMRVFQEPATTGRHTKEVRASVLGRDGVEPAPCPHTVHVPAQRGLLHVKDATHRARTRLPHLPDRHADGRLRAL